MAVSELRSDDLNPDDGETLEMARRRHLATCSEEVRRLRGLLVPTPASRLALVSAAERYVGTAEPDTQLWTRLRRATFTSCDPHTLTSRERLVLMAIAIQHAAVRPLVFAHATADAILDLPTIGRPTELVEYATPPGARGRKSQTRRRRTAIPPTSVDVDGLLVTDFERTVIDRGRYASLESALAAADAALHLGLIEQPDILSRVHGLPRRARGCKMAELATCLADGRSESPLESLSRARMFQLGLPMPKLQVKFYDAAGFIGRVDFFWPELGIVGEADGRLKFRVAGGLRGDEAEEAVWRAKRRDDRLLRHPDVRKVGHWDWGEALNAYLFLQVMADLGVRSVQDGGWPIPDGPLPRKSRHVSVIDRTHS